MRYWVQFLQHSTGYIPGTIPPQFGKPELIDAPGDRAVLILDGRNGQETMRRDALRQAQRMEHWQRYPAFVLCSGPRLFEETRRTAPETIIYPVNIN